MVLTDIVLWGRTLLCCSFVCSTISNSASIHFFGKTDLIVKFHGQLLGASIHPLVTRMLIYPRDRQGTHQTGCQSTSGLTRRDKQPVTLTPTGNLGNMQTPHRIPQNNRQKRNSYSSCICWIRWLYNKCDNSTLNNDQWQNHQKAEISHWHISRPFTQYLKNFWQQLQPWFFLGMTQQAW